MPSHSIRKPFHRLLSPTPFHSLHSSTSKDSSSSNILKHRQTRRTTNKRRKVHGNAETKLAKQLRLVFVSTTPRKKPRREISKLNQFSKADWMQHAETAFVAEADHCLSFAFHILSLEDTRPSLCLVFSQRLEDFITQSTATKADHRLPLSWEKVESLRSG